MTISKEGLVAFYSKITYGRYCQIQKNFSSFEEFWGASPDELFLRLRWKEDLISHFCSWRKDLEYNKIEELMQEQEMYLVLMDDKDYPPLLKEIHSPPIALFVRGTLENIRKPLAVVGTRKCSTYGKQITRTLVSELAKEGISIISGLAYGIDASAHYATLQASGNTIAVLGSGCDENTITPAPHRKLAQQIVESGGAVISEYPPGTHPTKYSFPERNRIISGISIGTLVIEAPEKSGALITSDFALNQNREVFAVPHNITNINGAGTNELIKKGSHVVTNSRDILHVFESNP